MLARCRRDVKNIGDIWIAFDSRISSPTNIGTHVVPIDAVLEVLPISLKSI